MTSSEVDAPALLDALGGDAAIAPSASLRFVVDRLTRPHVFAPSGLVPVSGGRETLEAVALRPTFVRGVAAVRARTR